MQTLLLQAEIREINLPLVEEFLKKIDARTTKINPLDIWENI